MLLVFFMNQLPPAPEYPGPFNIFSNIRGDIRKSRCTTGINDTIDTGDKFVTSSASFVDTGGKFATGVNDMKNS